MAIVPQSPLFLSTLLPAHPPFPLLAAPPQRPALPAPKIVGLLPAGGDIEPPLHQINRVAATVSITPVKSEKRVKRVVEAEIANPLLLIDIRRDPDAWWEEFERIHGRIKTIEELDAEIEATHPGYMARYGRTRASSAVQVEVA